MYYIIIGVIHILGLDTEPTVLYDLLTCLNKLFFKRLLLRIDINDFSKLLKFDAMALGASD